MSSKIGYFKSATDCQYCYSGNTSGTVFLSSSYRYPETILRRYSLIRKGLEGFIYANVCEQEGSGIGNGAKRVVM